MNRDQKKEAVEQQRQAFQDSEAVVVFHYRGTTMSQMNEMRQSAFDEGVSIKVTKNRLTKIALEGTKFAALTDLFTGPTAMAYSSDPVATAKAIVDKAKTNDNLEIIGGAMGETVLDAAGVKSLASLPSMDELRGKLVGLISAPAQRMATLMQAPASQMARVVGAYADKG